MAKAKYHVGQKLWIEPTYGRLRGHTATVDRVGRKWVTMVDGWRFDARHDLPTTEEHANWTVHESKEHADRHCRLRDNWSNFVIHLRHMPMPADMTTEKIIAAVELLGISYEIVNHKETTDG